MKLVQDLQEQVGPKGQFKIVGKIGHGGFGAVYLGCDAGGSLVAVKVHRPPASLGEDDATTLRRFRREIDFLTRFKHPLVPALVLASDPQKAGEPWFATRYVPGPSLQGLVDAHGALPPQAVVHLAADLASVLSAVHKLGAHRDMTPANALVTLNGAHLVDFGLAVFRGGPQVTSAKQVIASWEYAAPERVRQEYPAAPEPSDVFALGGTLFYAATRKPPYPRANSRTRARKSPHVDLTDVPREIRSLIQRCLDPDPRRRPTAQEVTAIAHGMMKAQSFADALGPELTVELEKAADEVLGRWRPVHLPRQTSPQMPVRGNGPCWTVSVGDWVQSVVAVPGQVVVVTVGGEVLTLAESDGEVVEKFRLRARPTGAVAAFGDRVYIGDADSGVHVVGRGNPIRIRVPGRVQGCVANATGVIVATGGASLYRIDDQSAALAWEARMNAAPGPGTLACSESTVYVGTTGGAVLRRDVVDGTDLGPPLQIGHRIVSIAAHRFGAYIATVDGTLHGLWDREDESELTRHPGQIQICRVDGDTLVTCTAGGLVRLLDLAGSALQVEVPALGPIRRSLTISNGLVVTGRVDGALHVLQQPSGYVRLWQVGDGIALDAPAAVTSDQTVIAGWADGTVAAFPRVM